MSDFLLIIDGSSLLSTQFFGNLPREIVFAKTPEEKAVYFPRIMQTSTGVYTNAVYGFMRVLLRILKEQRPAYLAVAWDLSRNTFRRELYPDYKGNRGETLAPLRDQFALCQEVLRSMKVPQFMDERYEADDFSGTLTSMFEGQVPVRIMTKDRDYLQLVSEHTQLWMIHSTAKKTEELYEKYGMRQRDYDVPDRTFPFTPELVEKEFGVKPESVNSLKGLQGDASDNIKGVPGVGEMTAAALIHEYGSVEALYDALRGLDEKGKKALAEDWKTRLGIKRSPMGPLLKTSETELVGEKAALLSKTLATIKRDIPVSVTLEELRLQIDEEAALKEFDRLEFRSLKFEHAAAGGASDSDEFLPAEDNPFDGGMASVGGFSPFGASGRSVSTDSPDYVFPMNPPVPPDGEAVEESLQGKETGKRRNSSKDTGWYPDYSEPAEIRDFAALPEELLSGEFLSFRTFCADGGSVTAALQSRKETIYIGEVTGDVLAAFLEQAAERGMLLVTGDLKGQLDLLGAERMYRLCGKKSLFDAELAAYLVNPLEGSYDYVSLAKSLYGLTLPGEKELFGKLSAGEAALFLPDAVKKRLTLGCNLPFVLAGALRARLEEKGMAALFFDLEMPLLFTLYAMQQRGILIRREELAEYGAALGDKIAGLESEICALAGEPFNINSPKQLGEILFGKLKLPGGKKTKTGYSTAADVLERLAGQHPIVEKILEYRQLAKLKSTYADGLAGYIAEDGRIHGTFRQTITATGRISSTDPNLQNIPIRMEAGRQLRRVFVPEDGFVFLDADYSQIELRVLAHLSGDERLIAAYREAQDIHRITASQVFHTPFAEVTKEQRSRAKAVNFGIVYGISSFGLGQGLNISNHEAEEYIKSYFETYPGVKEFMDRLVAEGRETGESRTLFGRLRPLPDISSTNHAKRSAEERVAMNAPIQGTAADIMKRAMLRVDRRLIEGGFRSRLLLQIHDELLVEVWQPETEEVRRILMEEMSGAAELRVPLEVSAGEGENWLDAH